MSATTNTAGAGPKSRKTASRHTLLPLILHTMRVQSRSALVWGVYLAALGILYIAIYPSLADQQEQLNGLINKLPGTMRNLFGFGTNAGFGSIEALLSTELLNFIAPLALSFFPILASSAAIAGAEEDGKIDMLMSNPISRWQLVVGSFGATAASLLGILVIMGLLMWLAALVVNVELPASAVANALLNLWPLCILFGGLAMLCSALFRRRITAIAVPGVVLVFMYVLNALGNSVKEIESLRHLSAFYYYGSAIEHGIDWSNFIGVTVAALVLVLLAVISFQRRDIYT